MPHERVTIGVIGMGGAGRAHARRFLKNGRVLEVCGYDPKNQQVSGVTSLNDFDTFLNRVDAVSICTPDASHYEYIIRCVKNAKHVLVEKPMVASADQATKLKRTLEENPSVQFAVHHQMRFVPAFRAARQILENNELGKVFYLEANYWHDMRERNTRFDNWRITGGGQSVIFGAACHPLDLVLSLVPSEIASHKTFLSKNAYQDYPAPYTAATTLLRFDNGVTAKVHTNNCVVFPQFNNLVILGDSGTYIDGILFKRGKMVAVAGAAPTTMIAKVLNRSSAANVGMRLLSRGVFFRQNPNSVYDHEVACQTIVDNFVGSVLGIEKPLVGYDEGCRVIQLCEATEADGLNNWKQGDSE